ncbi:uncharacterized protein LOC115440219 isoform X2 [Manduca sexta]|uniref:uncharacterized protein LOC115440219 isoform X2 n=1 Tax=Manduca sexta TaxID=7130 RepID=UPI00188FA58D|nr:uncharacterized protein LOC115440219 isoform X2 [Manduca sexta]
MNEEAPHNSVDEIDSDEKLVNEAGVTTGNSLEHAELDGSQTSPRSTYESLFWLLSYTKMFTYRLAKDLFITLLGYIYSGQVLPNHIVDLMNVQSNLERTNEPHTVTYSRTQQDRTLQLSLSKYLNAFKSYVLCSEDDIGLQCGPARDLPFHSLDKEPMFIIVDSSCVSNPSSKEILIDQRPTAGDTILKKYFNKNTIPIDVPSTSKGYTNDTLSSKLKESESKEELQMMDINLQSDNDIQIDDTDNESIVISYLRNKDLFLDYEELSESSLDAHIPSYPGSPRSLHFGSDVSLESLDETDSRLKHAVNFLHQDTDFMMAAEIGDDRMLEILISKQVNRHQIDHLGRNALHLAVCSNNERAMVLLLEAGVNPNVKDNLGMTPLSLCLMRRPSLTVIKLLFDYGAKILPRSNPMDTGLFLQFVMMCNPTEEEEEILRYLVEEGGLVTDAEAPGGRQPLHFAAMSNNCRLINILMDLGADLFFTNHRNETAREVATTFKCREALALLEKLEGNHIQNKNECSSTSLETNYPN